MEYSHPVTVPPNQVRTDGGTRKANTCIAATCTMGLNEESEREMERDVEEHRELYDALADDHEDE